MQGSQPELVLAVRTMHRCSCVYMRQCSSSSVMHAYTKAGSRCRCGRGLLKRSVKGSKVTNGHHNNGADLDKAAQPSGLAPFRCRHQLVQHQGVRGHVGCHLCPIAALEGTPGT